MYPHERSLVEKLEGLPFEIVGVNSDDTKDAVAACEEKNLSWTSFQDVHPDGSKISTAWEVRGWPTLFLIDAQGVIRHKNLRGKAMDKALTELLAEMGHEVDLSSH